MTTLTRWPGVEEIAEEIGAVLDGEFLQTADLRMDLARHLLAWFSERVLIAEP